MKETIRYWIVVILVIIGGLQVLSWGIDSAKRVQSLYSERAKSDLLEERYEDYALMAYSRGMAWGEIVYQAYDVNPEEYNLEGSKAEIAIQLLNKRLIDFHCWGADDCGELPTNAQLRQDYDIDRRGDLAVLAFRSGFVDSFVDWMNL